MVRASSPNVPLPRLDWTDATLALILRLTSDIVVYVGMRFTGQMVGCGNPSTILSVVMMRKNKS